jgi:hypothetical protein
MNRLALLILVAWAACVFPSGTAARAAFPIAEASLVKVSFHDNANGTSNLSGSVIACQNGEIVVVTNSHGTRDGVRAIDVTAPGIGTVPGTMVMCGNPDDKSQDLCVIYANLGIDLPVIPLSTAVPYDGESVFAAGFPDNAPRAVTHEGVVSGRSSHGNLTCSFTVRGGESGSPIVNANGELVAINWGSDDSNCHGVNHVHLMRLLETQCAGPTCQTGPVRALIGRCGQILRGGQPQYAQPMQPQYTQPAMPSQQFVAPVHRQDAAPVAQPALNGPITRPIQQASPVFAQTTTPAAIDLGKVADELAARPEFWSKLASDARFRGPPGMPGLDGKNGKDGAHGSSPIVNYDLITKKVEQMLPVAVSNFEREQPTDWLGTLTTFAAAFGLNIAIPGGAIGVIGLKLVGAWLKHRLAMRHAQRNAPAAEVSQPPFDSGRVSAETQRPPVTRQTTIKFEPPTREIETRNEIVHVPTVNLKAEALEEALMREVKAFPQHSPIVKRVRSCADQLLAGRNVSDSGRGTEPQKGSHVGWTD